MDNGYNFVFNRSFEPIGVRVVRASMSNLSRPTVEDVYKYRQNVDRAMIKLLELKLPKNVKAAIQFGLNLEEWHHELLMADIKYIFGHNPLQPAYTDIIPKNKPIKDEFLNEFISIPGSIYDIGYEGEDFCYDNERDKHSAYIVSFKIARQLVTNEEYIEFINDGGYHKYDLWKPEGADWIKNNDITAPLYWHNIGGVWHNYTLLGLKTVDMQAAACHISYYEAAAYAVWKGMRLATEHEWEAAAKFLHWGNRWEWTDSVPRPYPDYMPSEGIPKGYNSEFLDTQRVLRGASEITPRQYSRVTYRNFQDVTTRRLYTGIRLAQS